MSNRLSLYYGIKVHESVFRSRPIALSFLHRRCEIQFENPSSNKINTVSHPCKKCIKRSLWLCNCYSIWLQQSNYCSKSERFTMSYRVYKSGVTVNHNVTRVLLQVIWFLLRQYDDLVFWFDIHIGIIWQLCSKIEKQT